MKSLLGILLVTLLFASSCKEKEGYTVEGKIKGLNNPAIYVATAEGVAMQVDTIQASKGGKFIYRANSDTLERVILYMENGNIWTTAWAKNGDKIILSGDIRYPELIAAKGGKVNNLLTLFKEKNKDILREKADIQDKQLANINRTDSLNTEFEAAEFSSKLVNISQLLKKEVEDFVRKNPTSVASLVLIQDYLIDSEDPERIQQYLSLISGEATESRLYTRLQNLNRQIQQTTVGSKAPDFSVVDINNDTIRLETFNHRFLLLNFSASWCEICKKENEDLIKLRGLIKKEKLGILTISLNEDSIEWKKFAETENITWRQVIDNRGWGSEMVSLYNVTTIPTHLLIDQDKKIIARNIEADSLTLLLNQHLE